MLDNLSIAVLAGRMKSLGGWRCRTAAAVAGAASVLALAPFFAWPILWVTLPALVWLIDGAIQRGTRDRSERWYRRPAALAAEIGWWFGFGYFLAGLFWIGEAFLVDAEAFAVLLPFAVLLMPAGLALFYAAAAVLAVPFWRMGAYRVLALALSLSAMCVPRLMFTRVSAAQPSAARLVLNVFNRRLPLRSKYSTTHADLSLPFHVHLRCLIPNCSPSCHRIATRERQQVPKRQ